jgi:hypothetical protein
LRGGLYDLTSRISQTGTILLLIGEYTPQELRGGIEFSLADGIIQLDYEARSRSTGGGCGSPRCAGAATGWASTPSGSGQTASSCSRGSRRSSRTR